LREAIYRLSARFADGPFEAYPGVKEALLRLRAENHILHLVTAGDAALQKTKIAQAGLGHLFHSVRIVHYSKRDVLADIAASTPNETVMIGDSKSSDILPALELGLRAVWIPSRTWVHAHAEVEGSRHHTVRSFVEVPDLIATW
jgi:putative hydrolase of the HAD superfamily